MAKKPSKKTKKVVPTKKTTKKPVKKKPVKKAAKKPAPKKPVVKKTAPKKPAVKKTTPPSVKKPKTPKPPKVEKTPFETEVDKFGTTITPTNFFPNMVSISKAPTWAKGYIGRKYVEQSFADKAIKDLVDHKMKGTLKTKRDLIKQAESLIKTGEKRAEKEVKETIGDTSPWETGYNNKPTKNNDWDHEV